MCESLEERIVLDATVDPAGADDSQDDLSSADPMEDQQSVPGAESGEGSQQSPDPVEQVAGSDLNVVLVSSALDDIASIAEAAADGAQVVIYDASSADLAGIVGLLEQLVESQGERIDQLAVLSHGDAGVLKLTEAEIFSAYTVESDPGLWQQLGSLLSDDARIDLYGCDIGQGEAGALLVETIAQVTGATVWASDDATGNVNGADWDLEVRSSSSDYALLIDIAALDGVSVYLDNGGMTNPGFETGDLTGWSTYHGPVTLIHADSETYGGWASGETPYADSGEWIIRLDNNGGTGYDDDPSRIYQLFESNGDALVFAYNFVTDRDYIGFDTFGYRVRVGITGR